MVYCVCDACVVLISDFFLSCLSALVGGAWFTVVVMLVVSLSVNDWSFFLLFFKSDGRGMF